MREVYYASPWVPPEWIKAHGLQPRGIWQVQSLAEWPAGATAGACAFADSVTRLATQKTDSAFIFATHCDQMRRACDAVAASAGERIFLFNLPSTWLTSTARQLYRSELERLGRFLVRMGGKSPDPESLFESMRYYVEGRRRLGEAASWCTSRSYAEAIARFLWDGKVVLPQPEGGQNHFIPVAVAGGPLLPMQFNLLDAVEAMNGRVVLNATETGERVLAVGTIGEHMQDNLVQKLVDGFIDNGIDIFQRPNSRLYDWVGERLQARQARGLILWCYGWCDLWRAEVHSLRAAFGIPILALEADECSQCSSRNVGQVQAFMEALSR